ncbi:uncharacterized protein LODBEIA_P54000 [Lodderomyces beijingensis]|uniref:Vacuolar protein-sorting-associated protein 25 n=1 Tax=Lodderomyces beijingensis TaxID=1775926 RepID=A0ABP0ZVI7_9ASCO
MTEPNESQPEFQFPKIHSFPPLYTKQPNQSIHQQQLETWSHIILLYCEFYKITSLTSTGTPKHTTSTTRNVSAFPPIFTNNAINRSVNLEFKTAIFNHMISTKRAELIDHKKPHMGMFIYWRSIAEWGQILYDYVSNTGQKGTVLTLWELTSGGTEEDANLLPLELKNMDESLLIKVIQEYLVKSGKAQVLINEHDSIGGVKIV